MKRLTIGLALLLLASIPLIAQQKEVVPGYQENVDVNLVLVDVTVTDSKGNQILGLRKDDFIVKENGTEQQVESIDYFTNRRLLTSREDQAAFQVERVREERYFILFLHKQTESPYYAEMLRAKKAASEFIDRDMLENDRVAIAGYDHRLKIYSDFTSNKKALKKALDKAVSFGQGVVKRPTAGTAPSILANIDLNRMQKTGTVYEGIRVLSDSLRSIGARKVLVLFSEGIGEVDESNDRFMLNEEYRYQPMIESLQRSNVSVYGVNLRRNVIDPRMEQTVARMASETGGEYFGRIVSYSIPLKRIENENNGYYMLSYRTAKSKDKHGFQKIVVSLKNPEFRVKSREGYVY